MNHRIHRMSADVETLLTLAAAGDLPATTDYLMSLPRPARSDAIEIVQSVLPNPLAIKLNYNWSLYARDSQLPTRRRLGHLAHTRRTRLRQDTHRCRVGPRSSGVQGSPPNSPRRSHHTRSPVHHDRGRVRHHQRLATMEQAHIRTIQAKAHMAHRSARTRLLKPRARPAQRPTIRRRMVRRARLMGIPGRDLGQPLLRTQARTPATLSRHHHPQAHRACPHPCPTAPALTSPEAPHSITRTTSRPRSSTG